MPLFGHKEPVQEPVVQEDVPSRRRSMFSSKTNHSTTPSTRSEGNTSSPHRHGTGLLHRDREDSSITAAREQVINAEAAERQADKALLTARAAVKEAREQVKRLEREAAEEARLAKIKQKQAAGISKRGQLLGRHDRAV